MNATMLLLADSRLPAGGHAHSGGAEQAIKDGAVHDLPTLTSFLHGRLATTALVAASLAATTCARITTPPTATPSAANRPSPAHAHPDHQPEHLSAHRGHQPEDMRTHPNDRPEQLSTHPGHQPEDMSTHPGHQREDAWNAGSGGSREEVWSELEAEADARTASPAQREAARTQGRLLLRVARRIWPSPVLDDLASAIPSPHHPVVLGTIAATTGCTPEDAALATAYHAITGPATAAVRLLGLDPVAVHAVLAALTPAVEHTARAAGAIREPPGMPACAAPALDLLAERHRHTEARLFVS
ncbi:urease accessory UreF family protein [Streptosporangium sp. KLBMP 9127]|nr:urease accessory protein UreF [Streptosporangium sp. KLBMP 9127]